jgi:hypothetical protein
MPNTQVQFASTPLAADLTAFIHDNNNNPINVIEASKPWSVHVRLDVNAGGIFDGFCHFDLWVEQVGGSRTGRLGSVVMAVPGDGSFTTHVNVPANDPLVAPGNVTAGGAPHTITDSGVYHLVLVMTHHNQPPGVGTSTEATAVVDFGIVRVS